MSDNLRRYRAIRDALAQWYPLQPQGHLARHLPTLAALISGSVARKSTQLPHIAPHVPNGTKAASRVKHFSRWLGNAPIVEAGYVFPYAALWLSPVAWQTLVLVREGRGVGRGGVALRRHVVEKGRARPLAWRVRQGPQGHVPAARHVARGELVSGGIPAGAQVVLLGDGAGDGTRLQHTGQDAGGSSVCRTGCHTTAWWDGATFRLATLGACSRPGPLLAFSEVLLTREE